MKTKAFNRQVERIENSIGKWQSKFLPGDWKVTHFFEKEDSEYSAMAKGRWEYQMASIWWNVGEIAKLGDAELDEVAIHEYIHILLSVFKKMPSQREERAVTAISRAILRCLEKPNG